MSTAITQGQANPRWRKNPAVSRGLILWTSADAVDVGSARTFQWETGAPTHSAPQGSLYYRVDAADSDTTWYRATDAVGTWEAIVGSEITEMLAAANAWTGANTFQNLLFGSVSTLTIAAGAVAATRSYHQLDTEAAAASDDLDSITGGAEGEVLFVRIVAAARNVVLKHGVGANLISCLGARDITLDVLTDWALLVHNGSQWTVAAYSTVTDGILGAANTWGAEQTFGAGIALLDADNITLGTGDDDTIGHDGTLTTWTHAVGDLVIDNTDVNDQIILRLGTDTAATGFEVRNNSDAALLNLTADGAAVFSGAGTFLGVTNNSTLDQNASVDMDTTQTVAGSAFTLDTTISHATDSAVGMDVSISQITNARTAGDVVAYQGSITSLNGSTTGVDHVVFDALCTAGDADSDHIVMRQGANFSQTIDSRAATSGQVVWAVPDAAANALTIEDAAGNDFLTIDTAAVDGMSFGNATTNPVYSFLGTGAATFGGTLSATGGITGTALAADESVVATVACANAPGGATTALLSVTLKQRDNATALASARQVLLQIGQVQYLDAAPTTNASLTLGTVTAGSIVATITVGALYLVQTDATGVFACTATNTDDETVYLSAKTAEGGVSDLTTRAVVLATNSDSAAWSA